LNEYGGGFEQFKNTIDGFAGTSPLYWHNQDAGNYVKVLMEKYGIP